ncbi:MAG: cytochrome c [Candidatus Binatia bacterium]
MMHSLTYSHETKRRFPHLASWPGLGKQWRRGVSIGAFAACAAAVVVLAAHAAGAADGRRAYMKNCAPCHGPDGRGNGPNAALFDIHPRDLREGFLSKYSTDDLTRRVLDGRALTLGVDLSALRRRAADVEAVAAHLRRLPAADWESIDEGWGIYLERCAVCHGPFGTPLGSPAPGVHPPRRLNDPAFQASTTDESLIQAVRHGRHGMPAVVPRLSEEEAADVAAFVRFLSPGFETYSNYCAACHGDRGIGHGSFAESIPAPTVVFDRSYFARRDPEAVRAAIWHMLDEHQPRMPHFRDAISAEEAEAIVVYLRSGEPTVARKTPSVRSVDSGPALK